MGQEIDGAVIVGGQKVPLRGDFGSDRVRFSGGRRGDVPYKQVQVLSTSKGILRIRADGAEMQFPVGPNVDRLANKIRTPATRLEKMGVKPGLSAAMLGKFDRDFIAELDAVLPDTHLGLPNDPVDLLLVAVKDLDGLASMQSFAAGIKPNGSLWIIYPKNKRDIPEKDVLDTGRAAGLKDLKVVRFSEKLTALRFMRPLADR